MEGKELGRNTFAESIMAKLRQGVLSVKNDFKHQKENLKNQKKLEDVK